VRVDYNCILEKIEKGKKGMNSNWFKVVMKATNVKYGKSLLLKGIPVIFNKRGAEISIGNNVTIKSSFLSNLVGLYSRSIIVTRVRGAKIKIGNDVGISGATIYARKEVTIGDNTAIGGNVKILDNDFHPVNTEDRIKLLADPKGGDSDLVLARPISIGKNCFIGCNAIILKGTVIGDNCVIGAGAVVAGKFGDNCIIAGNPAKVIKKMGEMK
jgi:acetyltransferase-like isoleucine patch superfamily enzyme